MWFIFEKAVLAMAVLRLLSGFIEMMAGLLMLRYNDLEKSILINASLALIGPLVLITTMTIGLTGLVDRVSFGKITWVVCGVLCIFIGIHSK
ncbi:YqhV family protein [Numidum massiliense]|uniref:YqhV family protein n=1 Tax=Numidum massiliense TaxID=1522315 RepID=UPI0006D58999|nr:YqhV family protein [Numidum massiliense]